MKSRFHLSLPCSNIQKTKFFYINKLGAELGRHKENWIDINFYEHQITFINSGEFKFSYKNYKLDDKILPSFHIGVILPHLEWNNLYKNLKQSTTLYLDKTDYLKNSKGEHASFFVKDPNGYIVECKRFKEKDSVLEI